MCKILSVRKMISEGTNECRAAAATTGSSHGARVHPSETVQDMCFSRVTLWDGLLIEMFSTYGPVIYNLIVFQLQCPPCDCTLFAFSVYVYQWFPFP